MNCCVMCGIAQLGIVYRLGDSVFSVQDHSDRGLDDDRPLFRRTIRNPVQSFRRYSELPMTIEY